MLLFMLLFMLLSMLCSCCDQEEGGKRTFIDNLFLVSLFFIPHIFFFTIFLGLMSSLSRAKSCPTGSLSPTSPLFPLPSSPSSFLSFPPPSFPFPLPLSPSPPGKGKFYAVYVLDGDSYQLRHCSALRANFLVECLQDLDHSLRSFGSRLYVAKVRREKGEGRREKGEGRREKEKRINRRREKKIPNWPFTFLFSFLFFFFSFFLFFSLFSVFPLG